jgi:hypothetical protein
MVVGVGRWESGKVVIVVIVVGVVIVIEVVGQREA